jgi:hypothetical protein
MSLSVTLPLWSESHCYKPTTHTRASYVVGSHTSVRTVQLVTPLAAEKVKAHCFRQRRSPSRLCRAETDLLDRQTSM